MRRLRYLTLLIPAVGMVCVGTWASTLTVGDLPWLIGCLLFAAAICVPLMGVAAIIFDRDRGGR